MVGIIVGVLTLAIGVIGIKYGIAAVIAGISSRIESPFSKSAGSRRTKRHCAPHQRLPFSSRMRPLQIFGSGVSGNGEKSAV